MPTYCDKPQEIAQNPMARTLMRDIAAGNEAAMQWMWDFWCFTHVLDDLVDKDKSPSTEEVALALAQFVTALSINPFYQQHSASLYPLIMSAINRWIDGDAMDRSENPKRRVHAEVVRCGDIDLFLHIAFLTGGWEHMRALSDRVRSYDTNP